MDPDDGDDYDDDDDDDNDDDDDGPAHSITGTGSALTAPHNNLNSLGEHHRPMSVQYFSAITGQYFCAITGKYFCAMVRCTVH